MDKQYGKVNKKGEGVESEMNVVDMVTHHMFEIIVVYLIVSHYGEKHWEKYKEKKGNREKDSVEQEITGEVAYDYLHSAETALGLNLAYINSEVAEKKTLELIRKMDIIKSLYLADKDTFGLVMYTYENTFKTINETLKKMAVLETGVQEELYEKVEVALDYPYNEIVTEKSKEWATDSMDEELRILKDLKAKR